MKRPLYLTLSYPDSGNELTDGLKGDYNYYGSAWSAYLDNNKTADFVFDLSVIKSFEELRINFLQVTAPAIRLPQAVTLYVSNDGETWKEVASSAIVANDVAEYISQFRCNLSEPQMGRYVKVSVSKSGWLFIDEIELLAKSEDSPIIARIIWLWDSPIFPPRRPQSIPTQPLLPN